MKKNDGIAIVGIDCRYPGSNSPKEFWENILAARQQFRAIPKKRLDLEYYGTEDKDAADLTYVKKAAVLTDYHFDRIKYRVSKQTFEQTDLTHWLALDVAAGALADAGFENGEGLPKGKVGVILGNSLAGEFTRANIMRLRWPYVSKVFESTLNNLNYNKKEIASILSKTEKVYKEPFPKPDADTLAGGLSNTISGRICNYFDFNGGGYTVDGACSSSLLALTNGCNAIMNGEMEMALVGGVDLSIDPFEMIGFARNGALATDDMEVFGANSQGFWPGEGCGVALIMKESQAKEMGLDIYAVIRGWGISSDGKGGMTRPKPETQELALKRAYEKANIDISKVTMFEAHGTGTRIGDNVELTALANALGAGGKLKEPAIVSSVKHLIGHAKAAAGIAGVIKAAMATKYKVVPPSVSTSGNHAVIHDNSDKIKVTHKPILQKEDVPFVSGISSFGFGGINAHIVLESIDTEESTYSARRLNEFSNSTRDFELFAFAAINKDVLVSKLIKIRAIAKDISRAQLIDLSNTILQKFKPQGIYKASIVASTPDQLLKNIETLLEHLEHSENKLVDGDTGIFFNVTKHKEAIAFLFPGQGAPIYKDEGIFEKFDNELIGRRDRLNKKTGTAARKNNKVVGTQFAQPKIVKSTLQSLELLKSLGVSADYGIGHSLGEISALAWAKIVGKDKAIEIAKARGNCMSNFGEEGGAMLALNCDEDVLKNLIEGEVVTITGYNGKENYVIGGEEKAVAVVENRAFSRDIKNTRLKVSHAFHTPMMASAALEFKKYLKEWEFRKPMKNIVSTVTGTILDEDISFANYLYQQIESPVKFTHAIDAVKNNTALFIELGPGNALQRTLSKDDELNVLSLNYGGDSFKGFFSVLGAAYVHGVTIKFEELCVNRYSRSFDIDNWKLDTLVSPCEKLDFEPSLVSSIINATKNKEKDSELVSSTIQANKIEHTESGVLVFLKNLISEKTEIPVHVITDNDRIMSQLHLNSLVITEMVSLVAKTFNKSHKVYSAASILANDDGTIKDLGKLIFEGESDKRGELQSNIIDFSEYSNWTHIFKRVNVVKKRSKIKTVESEGHIFIEGTRSESMLAIENLVKTQKFTLGNGAVFVYQNTDAKEVLQEFIHFLKKSEVVQSDFVVLIQINNSDTAIIDLKPVFRSFIQEYLGIEKAMVLELPIAIENTFEIVKEELEVISNYKEIVYNNRLERYESQCEVFFPEVNNLTNEVTSGDVILASGGGKGITFESVLQLAQKTGARLALLGRSELKPNTELSENLAILEKNKISYNYYTADVCDEKALDRAIKSIHADFGNITMIIHGAGINNPKRIRDLQSEDFERTAKVKVTGLKNIVRHIKLDHLKFVVGYGSIIAQSGMQGNADYAFANDQLALYIDSLRIQAPNCRCLTLEWSVWDETGMGANLNSIDNLKTRGVWPIPVKNGLRVFESILADDSCQIGRYIISGRYGDIPTLAFHKKNNTLDRFVSKITHQIPEVEVISEVGINLNDDVFLKNHVFNGQYVFPTVMILEGMAQCCNTLSENRQSWGFENLKINKSIFIPERGANTIRFVVSRLSKNEFHATVLSEDSSFEVKCFEATIKYKSSLEPNIASLSMSSLLNMDIDVSTHFYDDLLFHHGPFRRIQRFHMVNSLASLSLVETSLKDSWFGGFVSANLITGDPGLNDAAIHSHQVCRPGQQLLPIGADSIYINKEEVKGPLYIHTTEIKEIGNETTIDVCIANNEGQIQQSWKGLVLIKVTGVKKNQKWISELLVPYLEYEVNKACNIRPNITLKEVDNLIARTIAKGFGILELQNDFIVAIGTKEACAKDGLNTIDAVYKSTLLLENLDIPTELFILKREMEISS